MKILAPVHQFEVRYTTLLNFSAQVGDIIAPYTTLAKSVGVEDESTNFAKYSLGFDEYNIFVSNDRVFFRYEGDITNLDQNNSFVDSIFFPLLKKIESVKNFGKVTHYLLYSVLIKEKFKPKSTEEDDTNKEQLVSDFSNSFFNNGKLKGIIQDPSDLAVIIEKKELGKFLSIQAGPYYGLEDLTKRKITIQSTELLPELNVFGYMADIKIFDYTAKVDFGKYKEFFKRTLEINEKLWD